jgi:predicted alpha-1,2-mannosidase
VVPFGLVQLGPDTRLTGWDGCSGYHFTDDVVYGFSHTHLSGTGISDYGDVLFMPVNGEPPFDNGFETGPDAGYASRFDKGSERAEPGWYAVRLADYGIDVELTATERTGMHRYRFHEGEPAWVLVDLAHRDEVVDSSLTVVDDHEISGWRHSTGWADDQRVYFVARFSKPIERSELGYHDIVTRSAPRIYGGDVRARLFFGEAGGELLVRVGISAVDVDGARRNLEIEQGEQGFDEIRRAARDRWNEALGRVVVEGGTAAQREIFYTALYHAMIAPNVWSDVDGRYRGMDGEIHVAEGRRHYTVFSLWDTFRSAHPLYTLIETERTREFIETFLAMYEQGGRLPVWELAANETDTMIGYHSIPVIADAWVKGIRDYDADLALEAMVDSATRDHFGLEAYRRQGFIGSEDDGESVSKTLEYAYDDWCIARMAESLERRELAAEYDRRSQGWRHLLDPETGFMRARRNQRWVEPFDPSRVDNNYTEANSWQYSLFVPHDVSGLIEALGGDERFIERLDALFEADSETTGRDQADITGLIGQYAHGNEPSHHMAWLYHHAGRPGESARLVRRILDELYTPEPDGLSGNEDCGQMSSWYVLAAIGLYPVTPCSDEYVVAPPLFDRVALNLENGRTFVVRTQGSGEYVESATLAGQPLTRSFVRHAEIMNGGELVLTLGRDPGEVWGRSPGDRPRSRVEGARVLAAPFLVSESDRFRDPLEIELASGEADAEIRYSRRPGEWLRYEGPIEISEPTRLRFRAEKGVLRSPVVESYLHRIPNDWTVDLESVPNPQYTAGGPLALIDGLRGDPNWRTGGWLGFQYADFRATVDLGTVRPVRRAGASFLQEQRSWIWMPAEVVVSISTDGAKFREVARLTADVAPDAPGIAKRDVVSKLPDGSTARYVRIDAKSYGTIPDWHPGKGDGAFIFIDEILID